LRVWLKRSTTPLVSGGVVPGAHVAQLWPAGDEGHELGRLVAGPVVGDHDHRDDFAGTGSVQSSRRVLLIIASAERMAVSTAVMASRAAMRVDRAEQDY
jgi:hypothetical protein